jgi:hypothetical protein
MARTDLTVQTVAVGGLVLVDEAANVDGEMFINTGKEMVLVRNAAGAPINVTLVTGKTVDGLAIADRVVAVANGTTKLIGPLSPDLYNQPSGADAGKVHVDFSSITTIFVAVIRLPV